MRQIKKIIYVLVIVNTSFNLYGQNKDTIENIILKKDIEFKIYDYTSQHEDYKSQIATIKKYKTNKHPYIRKNYYIWRASIGFDYDPQKENAVLELLKGLKDSNRIVVNKCESLLVNLYTKKDYNKQAKSQIKQLFKKQIEVFYILNSYVKAEEKHKKDSIFQEYKDNRCYYDVAKLIGYLKMKQFIPEMRQILKNFSGTYRPFYREACDYIIKHESPEHVIDPWDIHLALAHMGIQAEIKLCINAVNKYANTYKQKQICLNKLDDYTRDLAYVRQPGIIPVFKKLLKWGRDINGMYGQMVIGRLKEMIKNIPQNLAPEEYYPWLKEHEGELELKRQNALH